MSDDFLAKDWDARWRDRRSAEADGITQSQLAGATNDLQAQIISQLETDNRFLLNRIKSLEADIAQHAVNGQFLEARIEGLVASVNALLDEIRRCPDDYNHHALHIKDNNGNHLKLDAIYDAAFLKIATELGLPDPKQYLTD